MKTSTQSDFVVLKFFSVSLKFYALSFIKLKETRSLDYLHFPLWPSQPKQKCPYYESYVKHPYTGKFELHVCCIEFYKQEEHNVTIVLSLI